MTCCSDKNAIVIVRGNDTNFNGQVFLTLNLTTNVLDLSTFSAIFTLCGITKTFSDLSSGVVAINYSAEETKTFPFGESYGVLKLFDSSDRVATIESRVPFNIISTVSGDAIATRPYTLNFDVEQGGETILNVSVEAGVSVEVGSTTTLSPGSDATVTNSGTENHLVLDFGIPKGEKGDNAKINGVNSLVIDGTHGISLVQEGDTAHISGVTLESGISNALSVANSKVSDVLMAGTSIVINNIARIPLATQNSVGVVGVKSWSGLKIQNQTGVIFTDPATIQEIEDKTDTNKPITPATVDDAVKFGVTENYYSLSNAQKNSACTWLGAQRTLSQTQLNAVNSGIDSTKVGQIATNTSDISSLQNQVDNLKARGRFLALWNCATGLAESNPPQSPYIYQSGDYFIVGNVASGSGTNYKPSGSSYVTGVASTDVESSVVDVDDVYYYDGTNWKLQVNTQKTVSFGSIAGSPYDNTSLATALNGKLESGDLKTVEGSSLVGTGDIVIKTYHSFGSGWVTNSTTEAFLESVYADATAVSGMAYVGSLTCSDLPASLLNAEAVVEILPSSTSAPKVVHVTITSGNTSPYRWELSYWVIGTTSHTSGWIGFQPTGNYLTGSDIDISISSSSTDSTVPSSKCMWDLIGDVETLINAL